LRGWVLGEERVAHLHISQYFAPGRSASTPYSPALHFPVPREHQSAWFRILELLPVALGEQLEAPIGISFGDLMLFSLYLGNVRRVAVRVDKNPIPGSVHHLFVT
jgi:hypothetical protein